MTDLQTVLACRRMLEDLRQRAEELAILEKSRDLAPETAREMDRIIARCREQLAALRRELPELVSRSTLILGRLDYKERRVMMLYYVSGATLREAAQALRLGVRTVQKLKKAGLEALGKGD